MPEGKLQKSEGIVAVPAKIVTLSRIGAKRILKRAGTDMSQISRFHGIREKVGAYMNLCVRLEHTKGIWVEMLDWTFRLAITLFGDSDGTWAVCFR